MRTFALLIALAALYLGTAHAQHSQVLLINLGPTDVQVEGAGQQVHSDLEPGASKLMPLRKRQWIRMGQELLLFDTAALKSLTHGSKPVIQVGPGSKLFLLHPETTAPAQNPPKQPSGFPLRPLRRVDLT